MSDSVWQSAQSSEETRWLLGNQRYLQAELERIKRTLLTAQQQHQSPVSAESAVSSAARAPSLNIGMSEASELLRELPAPPALLSICMAFEMSPFERDVLLLCAGIELDPAFRGLCQQLLGDSHPTFALALATLCEPHLSALLPQAPLRRAQLLEVPVAGSVTHGPLRIEERILQYLTGTTSLDHRLTQIGQLVAADSAPTESLPPTLRALSQQLAALILRDCAPQSDPPPLLCLFGGDSEDRVRVAAAACQSQGLELFRVRAADLAMVGSERARLQQLCIREQSLLQLAVLLCVDEMDSAETARLALAFVDALPEVVLCSSPSPLPHGLRRKVGIEIPKLQTEERAAQLRAMLGDDASRADGLPGPGGAPLLIELAQHFHLGREGLAAACLLSRGSTDPLPQALWSACRVQSRPHLDDLARRIVPRVTWEDLILPPPQMQQLRQLIAHQRHQATVYLDWGMAGTSQRGLGVTALFVGQSGTGKTLAAEALAHELQLDLYHIDLSQIISKYIGETEKNLRRVFDAAEEGGAVLLFDEADALFGKRSEVKDSHDRYANIEVSYLLQRMESYQGISLLTSNLRSALDTAFLRRLRFIVSFPFPDPPQRAELWRRAFPKTTPTQGLSLEKLARLSVTGGQIRNIAMSAAFLAASQHGPITMQHILDAARSEYEKSERPLAEPEIRGWV